MKFSSLCLLLTSALALELHAATPQAVFAGLGDLAGGNFNSAASGISADGSTVVGTSTSANGAEAFQWTSGTGMMVLPDHAGGPTTSSASGSSATGGITCGSGLIGTGIIRAARWTGQSAPIQLGTLNNSGYRFSQATDISGDGTRIVGVSSSTGGSRAFLWTADSATTGTMSNLSFIFPNTSETGDFSITSEARAISEDGLKVVGTSGFTVSETVTIDPPLQIFYKEDEEGNLIIPLVEIGRIDPPPYQQTNILDQGTEAFLWTDGGTMAPLGALSGGDQFSEANAISSDGSVIVGSSAIEFGNEAVVWVDGVIGSVGDLDGGLIDSRLLDVTADGGIAVGQGNNASGAVALIWNEAFGIGDLNTLLEGQGVNLGGWVLTEATGISDDGQVIIGNGINPSGDTEAWRITDALTLLNILTPPPEGLQESMRVVRGEAAQFTAERSRSYQLLESSNLSTWTPEGPLLDTSNAGESFVHALPISPAPGSSSYLLGPSLNPAEADTPITLIEGTVLQYTSERGFIYQPEYSDDLITWTPFGDPVDTSSDAGPMNRVFIDTSVPLTHTQRFYRLQTALSGILTVPFDLYIGYSISVTATLGQDYQIQRSEELHPSGFPWINHVDYGPVITASGSAQPVLWHVPIPPINFGQEGYQIVSIPQLEVQPLNPASYGAVISFTAQPDTSYQVQLTTDGINFTNVGSAINTTGNTSALVRSILNPFAPSSPPLNVNYRVVENGSP